MSSRAVKNGPRRAPRAHAAVPPVEPDEGRPRHQRVLRPQGDSTLADLRLTIAIFSVAALLAILDAVTVRSGNQFLLAAAVLLYSFFRSGQGWVRLVQLKAA